MITIYLAGAIRDDKPEDIEWREAVIEVVQDIPGVRVLNPLAGKTYNHDTQQWWIHGCFPSDARHIVAHDFWSIDQADLIVANLTAMADGYPNIGTLMELGRATATRALIYVLVDKAYRGHQNQDYATVIHPFLAWPAARIFYDEAALLKFLPQQLLVMTGLSPSYGEVTE